MVQAMNGQIIKGHLTEQQIEQYAMGTLSQEYCDGAEEHLLICEVCQHSLEEMDAFLLHLQPAAAKLAAQPLPQSFPDKLKDLAFRPIPALAVSCAVLAAAFLLVPKTQLPPQEISFQSVRAQESLTVDASRPLSLKLDALGLPQTAFTVKIVDLSGKEVLTAPASSTAEVITTQIATGLPTGKYLIRILDSNSQLLREFAMSVR